MRGSFRAEGITIGIQRSSKRLRRGLRRDRRGSMYDIVPEEYPVLISAVERYVNTEEHPNVHVICAILGIEEKKKLEVSIKVI